MERNGLFADLLVLELANVLAGPSVGMFLTELGARVIKVESLPGGGDVTRTWKLPSEENETDISAYFSAVNWGKESIALDLGQPEGTALLYDLVKQADILIASYKPGDAARLKVDFASLQSINPALIYADISGYGPGDARPAFDAVLQAEAGFTFMNGEPGGPPVKMPVALIDVLAGHQLKEAILLALIQRMKTGKGSQVGTTLFGAALASLVNQATNWLVAGSIPQRKGSSHPNIAPYGTIFHTLEGKALVLAVGSDRQFVGLCEALGLKELAHSTRFESNTQRVKNRVDLEEILREAIGKTRREELLAKLAELKVPAGPVRDMEEVFALETAREVTFRGQLPEGRWIEGVRGNAFQGEGLNPLPLTPPPHFNQHGEEILVGLLGYGPEKIAALAAQNIIKEEEKWQKKKI
ncbi:MAG: CoA transferase [Bacteroidia bacterium]|nr:CoA transferase [Bacteroidia bacterium]